jgi:hypothetical protein
MSSRYTASAFRVLNWNIFDQIESIDILRYGLSWLARNEAFCVLGDDGTVSWKFERITPITDKGSISSAMRHRVLRGYNDQTLLSI